MKKINAFLLILLLLLLTISHVSADDRLQLIAYKTDKSPKLDGIITEEEWGNPIIAFHKYDTNVRITFGVVDNKRWPDYTELYTMWDDEYLYIGAVVTNETHQNNKTNAFIWQEDSLFIRLGLAKNQAAEYRFIYALGGENIPLGYLLNMPNKALNGTGKTVEILFHYDEFCVVRKDDKTTYEVRLRWNDYTIDERKIEKGFQFYLNMELNLKGKKDGETGVMMYGTYDDSFKWQYPQIKLGEQRTVLSPTPKIIQTPVTTPISSPVPSPTLMPSPSLAPTPKITLAPTVYNTPEPTLYPTEKNSVTFSPSSITPPPLAPAERNSKINFWWYLLILVPIALIVAIIFYRRKTRTNGTD